MDPELEEPPEGHWSCPSCEASGVQYEEKEEEKKPTNKEECRVCKVVYLNEQEKFLVLSLPFNFILQLPENLLYCSTCPCSYHNWCLPAPLEEHPGDDWSCPRCLCAEPKNRPEKVLSWRFVDIKMPEPMTEEEAKVQNLSVCVTFSMEVSACKELHYCVGCFRSSKLRKVGSVL